MLLIVRNMLVDLMNVMNIIVIIVMIDSGLKCGRLKWNGIMKLIYGVCVMLLVFMWLIVKVIVKLVMMLSSIEMFVMKLWLYLLISRISVSMSSDRLR